MIYLLSPIPTEGCVHLPMISFTLIEEELELDAYDLLMFTSKQAVKSAEALNKNWKEIPCLAIGASTAEEIKRLGGTVWYQPRSFYGKSLSEDIMEKFSDKNILYLRPKVVSFDSKKFLAQAGIIIEEKIIYETTCIKYTKESAPKENAIVIFTSPSTIHCFLENFAWDDSYTAIVIGEATKEHLPADVQYEVADIPQIDACISKAKRLLATKMR